MNLNNKKNNFNPIIIPVLIGLALACKPKITDVDRENKSLELFKDFGTELRTELLQAVKDSGSENAIEVCAKISPQMEEKISRESGLSMKRISDKNRNPNHAPQDWEREVLEKWKKDLDSGVSPAVFSQNVGGEYRVMKPIILDNATCLNCHGEPGKEINQATLEKIQIVYPDDKAKGYKMGELRGAFSATWKI